ncbi:MAG: amidophosphoribosyltransferase [Deltaproteobacteria bacterium]|nr:amidophosphoribosyltransferase [Deltaproteobacteria bacterium]MBI3389114.1 amidophosphoribosyltransferase [Deltaproteobacteria bacterium]
MTTGLRHECGVFGVFGLPAAARLTYLGLHALQHRGQESSGMVVGDGARWQRHVGMGLVDQVYDETIVSGLSGDVAIGHNRYSTSGTSTLDNAQPLANGEGSELVAVCHNGNLLNPEELAPALPHGTSDTRVFAQALRAIDRRDWTSAVVEVLGRAVGAFSLLMVHGRALYAVRDRYGFRPLVLGTLGDGWVVGSESCAFDLVGAQVRREIAPGELVCITDAGIESRHIGHAEASPCVFEWIYFSRPDSVVFGRSVGEVRVALGRELAREAPADADCVVAVPDSGNFAAQGFAEEAGLPLVHGLIRNHYVGRTFIEPEQETRALRARLKYNIYGPAIRGQRVVLVDDSLVRGTTTRALAALLRDAGARAVHMRISAPPLRHECFFGVDIPDERLLIAVGRDEQEIARVLGVDSVGYLSLPGVMRAAQPDGRVCHGCFSGQYPLHVGAGNSLGVPQ